MDTKQFSIIATLMVSLLVPTAVYAQDAGSTTPSQAPAKSNERIATLEGSASAYRSRGSMTQAFAGGGMEAAETCTHCRGWLVEAVLRWTDRMVTRLDPIGLIETPFEPAARDVVRASSARAPRWRPVPRLRPVQLHGGYGLVARITF